MFTHQEPDLKDIKEGQEIPPREIGDLRQFFSKEEEDAIQKEIDYYTKGLGKIESILNDEMGRLQDHMDNRIRQQDDDFL